MQQIPTGFEPWHLDTADPFEDTIGPFYVKKQDDGTWASAFYARADHLNMGGAVHGGMLMTFADQALFAISRECWQGKTPCVTLSMNSEFIAAAKEGDLIEASGEVTRETRSLIFVRGILHVADKTIMTFSGIIKKISK